MNGLLEILTNKEWMIYPIFLKAARPIIQNNLNGHVPLVLKNKRIAARAYASSGFDIEERKVSAKDGTTIYSWRENANDPFFSILYVDGPITRNGGECTYGSVEHRDMMMQAADNPLCIGHIFYINTPGGSAWAKNDYQQAIDYAHERGQKVYAFVDGMCCSAGMYLAALCDERYYMHPKDQIGCVGVMAAFYTIADGAHNQYDETTYHEIYDPESFEKNKEIRDIANDGNDDLLVEELTRLGAEFRADVKAACPKATDEHLHGKVFDAQDVKGILMDGQSTLADLFSKIIKDAAARGNQAAQAAQRQTIFNNNNNPEKNMEKNYQNLAKMMGVEELVVTNEGTHLDVALLDTLQTNIEGLQADAAKVADLTQQLADSKKEADETIANLQAQIASLNETIAANEEAATASAETIANLNKTINGLNVELNEAKASLSTAQQTIAERDQNIADLQAQVEELQTSPGSEPGAGASPANNGDGAAAPHQASNAPQWDPAKTPMENKKAMEEYEKSLKQGLH